MQDATPQHWCRNQPGSGASTSPQLEPPQKPDDEAVLSLDDADTELAHDTEPAEVQKTAATNRTEKVGPFDFTVFMDDAREQQSTHAEASCLINRVETCQSSLDGKAKCTSTSKASCMSVTGPKYLCTDASGGELIEQDDKTVCEFKGCTVPTTWVTTNGAPITQNSWCYVKNIEYGAHFVVTDDTEAPPQNGNGNTFTLAHVNTASSSELPSLSSELPSLDLSSELPSHSSLSPQQPSEVYSLDVGDTRD